MILHKLLKRGSDHPNFCEDFYATGETPNFFYCCIFDGCSGGKDSHFASTLFSKIFNDAIKSMYDVLDSEKPTEQNAKILIYMISAKISEIKQVLHLNRNELLSTMVLCTINKNTRECLITAFGDGYFYVDGTEVVIKNTRFISEENGEHMPDFIVYDLSKIESYNEFELWFSQKSEIHNFENVKNISIASDGICTFEVFKQCSEKINPIDFLVKDEGMIDTENMLERKYSILQNKYCMINTDDLSLIRIKFE